MFNRAGVIFIDPSKHDFEQIEELAYETSVEDLVREEDYIKIITSVDDFLEVEKFFNDK
jgi:transcriptional/translational regulatory protein YebC/TACO1